jgi:hypothetical protein
MKIISKYRDYYDSAAGYGIDTNLSDIPHTKILQGDEEPFGRAYRSTMAHWSGVKPSEYSLWYLAFAGRAYPLLLLYVAVENDQLATSYCWRIKDVEKALEASPLDHKYFNGRNKMRPSIRSNFTRRSVCALYERKVSESRVIEFHRRADSPVVLSRCVPDTKRSGGTIREVVAHPNLREIEFMRVVDPFTAFQDISGFLGGVLGMPESPQRPLSDEVTRDLKGFDTKSLKVGSPGKNRRRRSKAGDES